MDETPQPPHPPASLEQLASAFFQMAREMFLKDGTHVPVALLFQQGTLLGPIPLKFATQAEKDASSRALATVVKQVEADAILVIHEVWVGKLVPDSPIVAPSAQPDRQEALALIAENRQSESLYLSAAIRREAGRVSLGESATARGQADGYFAPVRALWKQQSS